MNIPEYYFINRRKVTKKCGFPGPVIPTNYTVRIAYRFFNLCRSRPMLILQLPVQ